MLPTVATRILGFPFASFTLFGNAIALGGLGKLNMGSP